MSVIHQVTPTFSVAGQLRPEDVARAAAAGFKVVVNNRPTGEEPNQPSDHAMRAAAEAAGMAYHALPFAGPPPPATVAAMAALLEATREPILAYCRSGRRSILAWGMAQALCGALRPEEIIALGAKAGYDLADARRALETLSPKP